TLLSFFLVLSAPGDPVALYGFDPHMTPEALAILRHQLGFDQPIWVQYVYWLMGNDWVRVGGPDAAQQFGIRHGLLRGVLGISIAQHQPVLDLIVERIPATLQLTLAALLLGYLIGIPLGLFEAVYHRGWFDQLGRVVSVIGNAVPSFWLGLILIIVFS